MSGLRGIPGKRRKRRSDRWRVGGAYRRSPRHFAAAQACGRWHHHSPL